MPRRGYDGLPPEPPGGEERSEVERALPSNAGNMTTGYPRTDGTQGTFLTQSRTKAHGRSPGGMLLTRNDTDLGSGVDDSASSESQRQT